MKAKVMTAFEKLLLENQLKGKAEGKAEWKAEERANAELKIRKAIERLLVRGVLSVQAIAEILDVPVKLVQEVRDDLLASGASLPKAD